MRGQQIAMQALQLPVPKGVLDLTVIEVFKLLCAQKGPKGK